MGIVYDHEGTTYRMVPTSRCDACREWPDDVIGCAICEAPGKLVPVGKAPLAAVSSLDLVYDLTRIPA